MKHNMDASSVDWKLRFGMEFDSMVVAWQFWYAYGAHTSFRVRRRYVNTRKEDNSITSCRFFCCNEELRPPDKMNVFVKKHRDKTNTNYKARISLVVKKLKFVIHEFVESL